MFSRKQLCPFGCVFFVGDLLLVPEIVEDLVARAIRVHASPNSSLSEDDMTIVDVRLDHITFDKLAIEHIEA